MAASSANIEMCAQPRLGRPPPCGKSRIQPAGFRPLACALPIADATDLSMCSVDLYQQSPTPPEWRLPIVDGCARGAVLNDAGAAVDGDDLPGDVGGRIGGEQRRQALQIILPAQAGKRGLRN